MIPFTARYPFLLLGVDYDGSLKWPMPDEHGVIHAYECKQFLKIIVGTNPDCVDTTPSSSCVECLKLDPSQDLSGFSAPAKHLRQILEHACDDTYYMTTVNKVYLTMNQLKQRKEHQIHRVSVGRFLVFNASQKIDQLLQQRTQTQKILQRMCYDQQGSV